MADRSPPSQASESVQIGIHPSQIDETNDEHITLPFAIDNETFPIPRCCVDEADGMSGAEWYPGLPLIATFVTWNLAQRTPNPRQVCDHCIRPNAHIVVVATQENGPYVGLNTAHRDWEQLVGDVCLQGKYEMVAAQSMWAIHMAVFVRKRDVLGYTREIHVASLKTGALGGAFGNKGGIGVAMTLSLRSSTMRRCRTTQSSELPSARVLAAEPPSLATSNGSDRHKPTDAPREETSQAMGSSSAPLRKPELTLLFVGTHLAAHQDEVEQRNADYLNITRNLPVGTLGPYRSKFLRRQLTGFNSALRDVTTEFDLCFFGGDLNYRIYGTKNAIEFIVKNRKALRSVLVHNDQLIKEMKKNVVFHGFEEGLLRFRPTYKYHMEDGVTTGEYDISKDKPRMPAYCDRILWKRTNTAGGQQQQPCVQLTQTLYTDCPEVKTSDHRPVVGMWEVATSLFVDELDADDTPTAPDEPPGCCSAW